MLWLSEIKFFFDYFESVFEVVICVCFVGFGVVVDGLFCYIVFCCVYDVCKCVDIKFMYIVDVEVKDEVVVFKCIVGKLYCGVMFDMVYYFVMKVFEYVDFLCLVVIGMGLCGLFVGLIFVQMGFCFIIFECGKVVCECIKDMFGLWCKSVFNFEFNVQFGEGGVGMFFDGKLYSQIKDLNYYGCKVFDEFVKVGVFEDILYLSCLYIGMFCFVSMVEKMCVLIYEFGGEVCFVICVDDIEIDQGKVCVFKLLNGEMLQCDCVVLVVGYSVCDMFQMLYDCGVYIEVKLFLFGFCIEYLQGLIDCSCFGKFVGYKQFGVVDYKVVYYCSNGCVVYSFCMCLGGMVVVVILELGCVVINGMSQYFCVECNVNVGIVVGIMLDDYLGGLFVGIVFQCKWEECVFEFGGGDYCVLGQLVGDFIVGWLLMLLGFVELLYKFGVNLIDFSIVLLDYVIEVICEVLFEIDKKIVGFVMYDVVFIGVEICMLLLIWICWKDDYQSMNVEGLYLVGEGVGYVGGIYLVVIDGIEVV